MSCSRGDDDPAVEAASGSSGAAHYRFADQGLPDVDDNLPDVPESDFEDVETDFNENAEKALGSAAEHSQNHQQTLGG